MKKREQKGILITFEGIDGSGKSSAARGLYEDLKDKYPVVLTREPGATQLGDILRNILQNRTFSMGAQAEYLLFAANRAQHFDEIVLPALEAGTIVISDRMADSSFAYQGFGKGVDPSMIALINDWVMKHREPDATVYLEIDFKAALKRLAHRKEQATVFEREQASFFKRVTEGFEEAFKKRSGILRIDGAQPSEVVRDIVQKRVIDFLNLYMSQHAPSPRILMDRS